MFLFSRTRLDGKSYALFRYQAANWQRVGETQGRTRQDRYHALQVPIKEIYVYPLQKHFRKVLVDEPA